MDINNIPKEILDQIPPEFLDNLDQLMQETRKPVFGEKVIEEHLPTLCRQAAAEGIVLLKNQGGALPLQKDAPVAVFGRVQLDYFYVGYGSGGDVNTLHRQPDGGPGERRRPGGPGAGPDLRQVERGKPALYGLLGQLAPLF